LDVAQGCPARGVAVTLEQETATGWRLLGQGVTDADGRARDLLPTPLQTGLYRLTFDTEAYFAGQSVAGFYPQVTVNFVVPDAAQHYHVPLLLSPFGYSTYRGS
jgi:5-hydroxyisourate hydrolase